MSHLEPLRLLLLLPLLFRHIEWLGGHGHHHGPVVVIVIVVSYLKQTWKVSKAYKKGKKPWGPYCRLLQLRFLSLLLLLLLMQHWCCGCGAGNMCSCVICWGSKFTVSQVIWARPQQITWPCDFLCRCQFTAYRVWLLTTTTGPWRQPWQRPWPLVLESLVRSGYLVPSGPNWDRDQLVPTRKLKITGPDRYKPVRGRLVWLCIGYKTGC